MDNGQIDQKNVITGNFGDGAGDTIASRTIINSRKQQAVQEKVTSYVSNETKSRMAEMPKTLTAMKNATRSFAKDVGMMPHTDAKTMSYALTGAAQLKEKAKVLRQELAADVGELRKRSDRYVRAAEGVKHWINSAESFTTKHPSITKLIKLALHEI